MKLDINPDVFRQSTGEELGLLVQCQLARMGHARLECFHRRREWELGQIRQVIGAERWTEALVAQMPEFLPRRRAGIALMDEVPLLSRAGEVVRRQPHLFTMARLLRAKELLTFVQPPQRVFFAS